jgi:hypothetical protein
MTQYWFEPKSYGYGATPVTWEGWAVTLAAVIILAGSVFAMNLMLAQSNAVAWLTWAALIAAATWWFVEFCRRRTDGEWHWRSGNRSDAPGI